MSRGTRGATDEFTVEANVNRHAGLSAYFLGPGAENHQQLLDYLIQILGQNQACRQKYRRDDDPVFITNEMTSNEQFAINKGRLDSYLEILNEKLLTKYSIPFWNPRYSAHMTTDISMPAMLGYISTMLFNPNNVSVEASPITTVLEMEAGKQLCKLLGYRLDPGTTYYGFGEPGVPSIENDWDDGEEHIASWGHITCGGTVANVESLWAARNLKFYPLSLRNAMRSGEELHMIENLFTITTCVGEEKLFSSLTTWELLNLKVDDILAIPQRIYEQFGVSPAILQKAMDKHGVQSVGQAVLQKQYDVPPMKVLITSTNHYSWPKACALTGIGSENMISIPINDDASMDTVILEQTLKECYDKRQPVYAVIGIVGSTEEGAVDDIDAFIHLRERCQAKGMSFVVHADAAWGGYFSSLKTPKPQFQPPGREFRTVVLSLNLRERVNDALLAMKNCDSITIDPHKSGYVPYPAGALCYRNQNMRYLLTWSSPYISRTNEPESVGVYGVEGSKPGAAAVAVWLSNCVIGMGKTGYGALLGEALYTSSMFSAYWAAMPTDSFKNDFKVVPFNKLPNEDWEDPEVEKKFIRDRILGKSGEEILGDEEALEKLRNLGSDLTINCFTANFRIRNGEWNTDVEMANRLNKSVVKRMSSVYPRQDPQKVDFFLTSTEFRQDVYGQCADTYKRRLGLVGPADLFVMRNVVMNPHPTTGDFVGSLAQSYGKIIDEEIERLHQYSDPNAPKKHRFVVQGNPESDRVYLAYLPSFYNANSSSQLILTAKLTHEAKKDTMHSETGVYILETTSEIEFSALLSGSYEARIWSDKDGEASATNVTITDIQTQINRSIQPDYRDREYPENLPFYLYGSTEEGDAHISHMLLKAPNLMYCASELSLTLDLAWKSMEVDYYMKKGCIAVTKFPERACQPFSGNPSIFQNQEQDNGVWVEIYRDEAPINIPIQVNANGLDGLRWNGDAWEEMEAASGPGGLYDEWLKEINAVQPK
ncbi:pyridoxal-dependent decarboxylase domain protein [Pyronema omphalodes]|nr:pyridoxal-dependent decarboxylase domain protein [Pyronema omphalodes]